MKSEGAVSALGCQSDFSSRQINDRSEVFATTMMHRSERHLNDEALLMVKARPKRITASPDERVGSCRIKFSSGTKSSSPAVLSVLPGKVRAQRIKLKQSRSRAAAMDRCKPVSARVLPFSSLISNAPAISIVKWRMNSSAIS